MKNKIQAKVKRKMQNVNFKSIDEFLDFLPEKEVKIVEHLRKLVLDCMPGCMEKLSYNVPYYRLHSNVCFIWPASVKWGNSKQKGVRLGFTNGHLIPDETGFLERGKRKFVYWHDFFSSKEIDTALVKSFIYEAVLIDKEKSKKNKNR